MKRQISEGDKKGLVEGFINTSLALEIFFDFLFLHICLIHAFMITCSMIVKNKNT